MLNVVLSWTGYESWSQTVNARERTQAAQPVTKWELAQRVANKIQNFYNVRFSNLYHCRS